MKKDKFINKIFQQIQEVSDEIFVVDDKLGIPTYMKSIAGGISKIIHTQQFGLYNQICKGDCNHFEIANEFIRLLGMEKEIKIIKVTTDHFKEEYFAPCLESERLINITLKERSISCHFAKKH